MGSTERKVRERTAMKKMILKAALDLYVEKGLDCTTIRKIAERIEYSPAAIYLYYPSKHVILYHLQRSAFDRLFKCLRLAEAEQTPLGRLRLLGRLYMDFGIKNPREYELMYALPAAEGLHPPMLYKGNAERIFAFIDQIVNACLAEKLVGFSDTVTAPLQCWSMLHGLLCSGPAAGLSQLVDQNQSVDLVYRAWQGYVDGLVANALPSSDA